MWKIGLMVLLQLKFTKAQEKKSDIPTRHAFLLIIMNQGGRTSISI